MPKKYTGRERRSENTTSYFPFDRRSTIDRYDYLAQTRRVAPEASSIMSHANEHAEIISIKSDLSRADRRHGPGRRKGDLKSALKTGRPVVYQIGKLAEKIIKKKLKLGP